MQTYNEKTEQLMQLTHNYRIPDKIYDLIRDDNIIDIQHLLNHKSRVNSYNDYNTIIHLCRFLSNYAIMNTHTENIKELISLIDEYDISYKIYKAIQHNERSDITKYLYDITHVPVYGHIINLIRSITNFECSLWWLNYTLSLFGKPPCRNLMGAYNGLKTIYINLSEFNVFSGFKECKKYKTYEDLQSYLLEYPMDRVKLNCVRINKGLSMFLIKLD